MRLTEKDIAKMMENTITVGEQFRCDNIIDFVGKHQGCTAEDIVKGDKTSGRVKTFRILKDLKKENVIQEEKSDANRRNKKLFLNEANPLVSFPKEVEEFKEYLFQLFMGAQYYRSFSYNNEAYPNEFLLGQCFSLFFEYLNLNNYRAFTVWPNTIKDRDTLSKLYIQFYSKMTELNLQLQNQFQPVEFGYKTKRKITVKGMDEEQYKTIAKNVAQGALNVSPDDIHFEKMQRTFYDYKLENVSRPVVHFLMNIRKNIYYSEANESEQASIREFDEARKEDERVELQKEQELKKLAKKLSIIEKERRKNRNNPYPYCNYDYGSVKRVYDPITWKTKLTLGVPDITHLLWRKQ